MANKLWDKSQKIFRQCLKNIRLQANFTQNELAALFNKPQSYISKYEAGERKLDYLEVRAICQACSVSIADLEKALIASGIESVKC